MCNAFFRDLPVPSFVIYSSLLTINLVVALDIMKDTHLDFTFKDSGLVVSSTHPFIRASPDGCNKYECCTA